MRCPLDGGMDRSPNGKTQLFAPNPPPSPRSSIATFAVVGHRLSPPLVANRCIADGDEGTKSVVSVAHKHVPSQQHEKTQQSPFPSFTDPPGADWN